MAEVHRQIQNQLEEMVSTLRSVVVSLCRGWPQFIHLDAKYICNEIVTESSNEN